VAQPWPGRVHNRVSTWSLLVSLEFPSGASSAAFREVPQVRLRARLRQTALLTRVRVGFESLSCSRLPAVSTPVQNLTLLPDENLTVPLNATGAPATNPARTRVSALRRISRVRRRASRQAPCEPDLLRAPRDRVGKQPIEADRRQQRANRTEESGQDGHQALGNDVGVDLLRQGGHASDPMFRRWCVSAAWRAGREPRRAPRPTTPGRPSRIPLIATPVGVGAPPSGARTTLRASIGVVADSCAEAPP